MAITPNDFSKIWASNADTPEYTFSEADYLKGWDFVGNLPPTRAQWNAMQKSTDEKMKYVFDNFGAPLTASTVAEMTLQNRVYVYIGSEVGYTAGHWYYYAGNAWTDGGVYNAVAFNTDPTLTISGAAADAKATGDELANLKDDLHDPEYLQDASLVSNLYNYNRRIDGFNLNVANGSLQANANYCVSDYIPVEENFVCRSYNCSRYVFYDINKDYISGASSALNNVAPQNAKFVRVDIAIAYKYSAKVYISPFRLPENRIKFLVKYPWLDIRKISASDINGAIYLNAFNKETAIDGSYVSEADGTRQLSANYFSSDFIPAKENTKYTMSKGNRYACYDENKQFIIGGKLSGINKEFTTPANTKFIIVCGTPLSLKDSFIVAESEYYTQDYKPYSIIIPWLGEKLKSKYTEKTLVCFGDSITNMGYTDTIKADTGLNAVNVGLSSGRYAYSDDSNQYVNAFAFHNICYSISTGDWTIPDSISGVSGYETQYAHIQDIKNIDFTKVDFVSIAYGTNDFSSATELDNDNNPLDTNTFKGAIRYCLKLLTEKYPHLKIIGVTPCYRFWSENGVILYDSDEHAVGGMYLRQFVQAVEDVFTEYHLPVVNNYSNAGINKYNRLQYFNISDGLHPNSNGRDIIGHRIGNGILADY